MSRFAVAVAAVLMPVAAMAEQKSFHRDYLAAMSTHRALQAFHHIVADKHFIGYFVKADGGCAVTVITSRADDDRLAFAPVRRRFEIRAGGRIAITEGESGDALAIGCTADAEEIKVVVLKTAAASIGG